uniref:Uncharacterized LOC100183861 n=1 Tax=Ciona intestinalis TaxID=7719 RepID=H2XWD1_CIOIN|nr:uncharacterized protein LOC100183861 [Ciona intestinalis]|eukprot:XP_002127288.1 uncharacterized protein LOC100183861 [Ciona intestinalis]
MSFCGNNICNDIYGEVSYCCGFLNDQCCYKNETSEWYSMWYIWVGIVSFLILLSLCFRCWRQQQQIQLQNTVLRNEVIVTQTDNYHQPLVNPAAEIDAPPSYDQVQRSPANQYPCYNTVTQSQVTIDPLPPRYQQ